MSESHLLQRSRARKGAAPGKPDSAAAPASVGPQRPASWVTSHGGAPFSLAGAVQRKVTVGQVGDAYEREADLVADRVASGSTGAVRVSPVTPGSLAPLAQRCAECEAELQRQAVPEEEEEEVQREELTEEETLQRLEAPDDEEEPVQRMCAECAAEEESVQRMCAECEEEKEREAAVQTKALDAPVGGAARLGARLQSPGAGAPLAPHVRASVEPVVRADLSGVRVHTDSQARSAASSLHARAFTHGSGIWLGPSESPHDVRLMAHEAAHVVQQGAARASAPPVQSAVQRLIPSWILEELDDYARHIPGWTLFTVIVGVNPLTGEAVERTPTNLLGGFMGLVPFGTAIFDKLNEHGIVDDAFAWVEGEMSRLDLSLGRIERTIEAAWEDVRLVEGFDYNLEVLRRHFGALYDDVVAFARSLVDHVLQMIKEAVIGVAESLLAENRAWALAKKLLGRDPLRDEPVEATPTEILEDFLLLIGQEQHLQQMRERGVVEEAASWIVTQIDTFLSLLGELRGLIARAWDAIQPENLPDLMTSLRALATDAGAFLQRVWDFASTVAARVLEFIKDALLGWLAGFAHEIPGFHLLTVILGRNPFTGEAVPRTAENLIRGFITLLPGGAAIYAKLEETGTIARAGARIDAAVEELGISWDFIVGLFRGVWDSLSIDDLIDPIGAFQRIVDRFGEPISRLFRFVGIVLKEVISIVLEIMNFPSDLIASIISNAMQAIEDIKRDPIQFLLNLLAAVKKGFLNFFDNIVTHLVGGLSDWLFRGLRQAGLTPPRDLSLGSVLDFVLQVLGISMERIWEKLADRIGRPVVDRVRRVIDRLSGIWSFVRDVQERGVAAIWEHIQSQISGLWDMILQKAKDWIMERIINRAIQWLLSLLDITGIMPVINSFIAFFNAVQSAIEYLRDILAIINDWVTTVASVARGEIEPGAQKMERGLAAAIPVAIGFLANQFGLGNIGEKITEIVGGIRAFVDRALDWLLDRAVAMGRSILDSLGLGGPQAAAERAAEPGERVNLAEFQEANEEHDVYIDLSGAQPQLMVASETPQPVPTLLDHLERRLGELPTENNRRGRAQQLIGQARTAFAAIPVSSYQTQVLRRRGGQVEAAATQTLPLSVQEASERGGRLGGYLRELFQIFCISRNIPSATAQPSGRSMSMFVEITVEDSPTESSVPAGTAIPSVPGPRGEQRRIPTGGQVFTGAASAGGRTFVQARTWNVGEPQYRGDSTAHAETQFAAWFAAQPESWRRRVRALEVHNRPLSPCASCAGRLKQITMDNPGIQTALLFWSTPYVLEPITTRPDHIADMESARWVVHPGGSALSSVGADLCPRPA